MSNGLDPDQVQFSVNLDLGLNCLKRLSADEKVATSKKRVNIFSIRMVKDTIVYHLVSMLSYLFSRCSTESGLQKRVSTGK